MTSDIRSLPSSIPSISSPSKSNVCHPCPESAREKEGYETGKFTARPNIASTV